MTLQSTRDRLDLDQAMRFIGATWTGEPHIRYDPAVRPQYRIRRASRHDGTAVFSVELMTRALFPLLSQESYFKPMGEPPPGAKVRYTVGRIKCFSVYGRVTVPAGNIIGQRECVVIPVRCEYVS